MTNDDAQKTLLQRLWDRRFFQYLATYIGVCWGVIQFTDWIVNRYNLDSSWVDNLVIFLFVLLPGMASFIYFHGRPGDDAWQPFEKVLYPINFVIALLASFLIFDGNAVQKTRQVEVTNELGDTITRIVPSNEYTSRVVFFPFESDLSENDSWMGYGVPILADYDIEQDMKWYSVRPTSLKNEYLENGLELGDKIPFATQLQIASNMYCDFFVTGNLSDTPTGLKTQITVYNANTGKEKISTVFEGKDLYDIADQISSEIRNKINRVKLDKIETYIDLPSSDLVSGNSEALKYYIQAILKFNEGVDSYAEALQMIEKSVSLDPNCAECQSYLMVMQNVSGLDGKAAIAKAMEKGSNLPERQKLRFNYYNYQINRQPKKMVKLLEMWKELYPQDVYPFEQLMNYYKSSLSLEEAEKIIKEALDNGHSGNILLSAANINLLDKDFEEAEKYINEFVTKYPKKAKNNTLLGDIYVGKGQIEKGLEIYEESSILNPNDINIKIKAAEANYKLLNFNESEDLYNDALSIANTPNDSLSVYIGMMSYYARFGNEEKFTSAFENHKNLYYRTFPKQGYIPILFQFGSFYSKMEGNNTMDAIEKEIIAITPSFSLDVIKIMVNYLRAQWYDDKEAYKKAYEEAKPLLSASGGKSATIISDAIQSYFDEDYEKALEAFLEFEDIIKAFSLEQSDLVSDCYINLNQHEKGLEYIDERLKQDKNHPLGLLSKFRLLIEMNKHDEAKSMINKMDKIYFNTSELWKDRIKYQKIKDDLSL